MLDVHFNSPTARAALRADEVMQPRDLWLLQRLWSAFQIDTFGTRQQPITQTMLAVHARWWRRECSFTNYVHVLIDQHPQPLRGFLLGELPIIWSRGLRAAQYLALSIAQTETLHHNASVYSLAATSRFYGATGLRRDSGCAKPCADGRASRDSVPQIGRVRL